MNGNAKTQHLLWRLPSMAFTKSCHHFQHDFQLETRHVDNGAKWWSVIPSFQHTNFVKLTSVKHEQMGTYFRLESEQTCAIRTWLLQRNLCNHTQKCGHKSCIVNLCMPPGSCNVSILCIRMFYFCLQQSIATVLRFNKHLADVHLRNDVSNMWVDRQRIENNICGPGISTSVFWSKKKFGARRQI